MADWGYSTLSFLDSSVALISLGGSPGKTATIALTRRGKASLATSTVLVVNWKSRKKILILTKLILAGFFPARLCVTNIVLQDTARDLSSIKAILVTVIWCTGAQAAPRINWKIRFLFLTTKIKNPEKLIFSIIFFICIEYRTAEWIDVWRGKGSGVLIFKNS